MHACIDRGIAQEGMLPGGLKVRRRARAIEQGLTGCVPGSNPAEVFEWVSLWALAVNEENAAGGRVITAPTNGAAGVLPAVLRFYETLVARDEALWSAVRGAHSHIVLGHPAAEIAETFFNSVTTKILHRMHFRNDFIFVRPAVSTEYIDDEEGKPTFRAFYPTKDSLRETLKAVVESYELAVPFDDLDPGSDDGAVTVLTFHAAKGREWAAVVVAGVEDSLVPHASAVSAEQLAEEARLFYVALTRAADDLVVTSAATRNGRVSNPSRWLAAVAATTADHELTVPAEPMVRQPLPIDPLKALRDWRAAVARAARVAPADLCSDRVLRSLLEIGRAHV